MTRGLLPGLRERSSASPSSSSSPCSSPCRSPCSQKFTDYDTVTLRSDQHRPPDAGGRRRQDPRRHRRRGARSPRGPRARRSPSASAARPRRPHPRDGHRHDRCPRPSSVRSTSTLVPPAGEAGRAIREGDVIPQDRSSVAIEVEQVLTTSTRCCAPSARRARATLNALATALEGRGEQLGENLVLVNRLLHRLNPQMPLIEADISGLADLATPTPTAAPDLLTAMDALRTTNTTIVEKQGPAGRRSSPAPPASPNTTAEFLEKNDDGIIRLGQVQRPSSPCWPSTPPSTPACATGIGHRLPRIREAFRGLQFHITLETLPQQPRGYRPGDEPGVERRPRTDVLRPAVPEDRAAQPPPRVHLRRRLRRRLRVGAAVGAPRAGRSRGRPASTPASPGRSRSSRSSRSRSPPTARGSRRPRQRSSPARWPAGRR